jgi:hypothetical protein
MECAVKNARFKWTLTLVAIVGALAAVVLVLSSTGASQADDRQPGNGSANETCAPGEAQGPDGSCGLPGNIQFRPPSAAPTPEESDTNLLPDCVPVDAGSKVVGCTRKSDLAAAPDQRDYSALGLPVYDLDGSDTIVGYLSEVGFVPNSLVDRFADLKKCEQSAQEAAKSQGKVDSECAELLTEQGVDQAVVDAVS